MAAYAALAVGRGVDNSWDYQHYHLAVGWSALTGHLASPDWVVAGAMSFFNPFLDALYALFALVNPWLAHTVFAVPGLLACGFVASILQTIWPAEGLASWTRNALAMLSVMGSDALGQIGGTMGDLTLALPIAAGVWCVHRSLAGLTKRPVRQMIIGCALFGIAMGLKITVIPVSVGLCIGAALAVVVGARAEGSQADPSKLRVSHVALGWLLGWGGTGLPWSIYLVRTFGSPIFPFLNNVFRSRWATTDSWATPYHLSLVDLIVFPIKVAVWPAKHNTSPYSYVEPRFLVGVVGCVLLGWTVWRRRRQNGTGWIANARPVETFFGTAWLISYLLWAFTLANGRYAIPLVAVAVPCAVLGARALQESGWRTAGHRGSTPRWLAAALGASTVFTLTTGLPEWGPRTTHPMKSWQLGEPVAVDREPLPLTDYRWQDLVIVSDRWPLGFVAIELEPRRVWNLRERETDGKEHTRFAAHAAATIDRNRSLVAYDPRLYDWPSIAAMLEDWLGAWPISTGCGTFQGEWTPAMVCTFRLSDWGS